MAKTDKVTPPGVSEAKGRESVGETPQAAVNVKDKTPEGEVYAPKVGVTSRGKISSTLEGIAEEFRRLYPDQECRWVYHSATKPELSNVISRMAEGYAMIEPSEFKGYPIDGFVDEKKQIRVADVVLMKIPSGQRQANLKERQRLADAQIEGVKHNFRDAIDQIRSGEHRAASRGAVKIEERDHDISHTQPQE